MTQKWTNHNIPGALHYSTGNLLDRKTVFDSEFACNAFCDICLKLKDDWPAKLIAYVIMPDHFHIIVNPVDGNVQGFIGALKSKLAIKFVTRWPTRFPIKIEKGVPVHQVWQESFKAIPLWSSWMIWQKINYIHANPVKAKLVKSANDYKWSSWGAFYSENKGPLPVDKEWWWPDDSQKLSAAMKALGWRSYHNREK